MSASVVVIDDFPLVLEGIAAALDAYPGIRVVGTAGTAAEGIALAGETAPDVIILDLYMPDMSGIRALAELRQQLPAVMVLMVTASEKADTLWMRSRPVRRGISPNHLMRIREKTGLRRRSELTHWAVRNSVV